MPTGHGSLGRDIGWPNCPPGLGIPSRRTLGKPMPPAGARYVLIGLTNGPAFYPNPCLRDQVAFARSRHLWTSAYAVVTYPTPAQLATYGGAGPRPARRPAGQLFNTGWAQARQNLAVMRAAGLQPPTIWVDVEPVRPPAPWSGDTTANRAVLEGSIAAYRRAGAAGRRLLHALPVALRGRRRGLRLPGVARRRARPHGSVRSRSAPARTSRAAAP